MLLSALRPCFFVFPESVELICHLDIATICFVINVPSLDLFPPHYSRLAQILQIAKVVTFLASDDAAMVTGSIYLMDGGWSIKA